MDLREKIKVARNTLGITQDELAKYSGISIQNIKKLETKENTNPTNNTLQKLAIALKVNSDYFVSQMSPNVVSQSQKSVSQMSPDKEKSVHQSAIPPQTLNDQYYSIPKLNLSAQAGGGNEILDLQCYESGEVLTIDKAFFKAIPSKNLKAIRVEGYSMMPMLMPDSWVVFEDDRQYRGDGLYIINYGGQLMVKLLQLDPIKRILDIISVNKDYKSYSIPLEDSQIEIIIAGKVLRCII